MTERTEKSAYNGQQKQNRRFNSTFVIAAVLIAAVIGFIGGTRSGELMTMGAAYFGITTPASVGSLDLGPVQETYRQLKESYNGKLDETKLVQYASKGLVEATDDPYTQYFTAEEAKELNNDLSGKIGGGIGAELGNRNSKITVVRPLKGQPAEAAGVQAGDVILAVNGTSTANKTVEEVVKQVRGEVDTTVKLTLQRGIDTKEVSVKRAEITAPDVESSTKDGIGLIEVSRFDKDTGSKVRAVAEDMKRQSVKGVVLDLRGNPGGYLDAGVDVASVWLNGKLVVTQRYTNKADELKAKNKPILEGVPTVVLIDAGSASASEIVAGALRDHKAATLIGEKSYGKGSVQELRQLPNGDELKVTIAKWYTPAGKNISKDGIHPDEEVKLTHDDVNANKDPQLEAALRKLIK